MLLILRVKKEWEARLRLAGPAASIGLVGILGLLCVLAEVRSLC
jgi:hypothetical protein